MRKSKKDIDIIKKSFMQNYSIEKIRIIKQKGMDLHTIKGFYKSGGNVTLGCLEDCTITVCSTPTKETVYRVYNRHILIGDVQ